MNPNLDDENEDSLDETSLPVGSIPESVTPPEPTPPPINPILVDMLNKKAQGRAGLEEAQKKANTNQLLSALGRAGSMIAQSTIGNSKPIDTSNFDEFDKAANAPVDQFLTQQKEAKADPNSPQSKSLQAAVAKLYPGKFSPEILSSFAAEDIDKLYKPLELKEAVEARRAGAIEKAQDRTETRDAKAQAVENKAATDQEKAYTTMRKDLESFRGNQSVQLAATATVNADKALALVKSNPTSQNLSLLAEEMGKIATGGVPNEHGTHSLMPSNLYTKIAEMKSFLSGNPSSADVSEYLKNNEDYINQVKDISAKAVHDYRANIAKGYKNRVSKDDYSEAVSDYNLGGSPAVMPHSEGSEPVARKTSDGRTALFDPKTKAFLRYQ